MNIARFFRTGLNCRLVLATFGCLLLASASPISAADPDRTADASAAARAWIAQIDAGKYEDSYAAGCGAFRDKVPEKNWILILQTLRGVFGPVINRKEVNHLYKPEGFDSLDGECMVFTYDTDFKKLPGAAELVVMKREGGVWRGAGYNAGRKSNPAGETQSAIPGPQTESESHTTKTPPQSNK